MVVRTEQTLERSEASGQMHPRLQASFNVLAVLAVAAFLTLWDPVRSLSWARCPFHALTGLHCAGCGTLRALHQLLHGHLRAALGLNPLTISLLPFLAYPFLSNVVMVLRGRSLPRVSLPPWTSWALLWTVLAFWIARNIPVYPFTLLAP